MSIPKKKGGRPSKKPSMETLSSLYEHMTAREIAEKYGVSVSTVNTWLWNYRKSENSNDEKE